MQDRLLDIERLKAENKRLEELLTKWKDKRIEILIKENRELRAENKKLKEELAEQIDGWNGLMDEIEYLKRENKKLKDDNCWLAKENAILLIDNKRLKEDMEYYIKFYEEHDWPIDRWAYDNEDGLIYEEWLYD